MELTTVTAKQLIEMKITKLPTLVEELLPSTGLAVISGPSDAGKTTWCRQLAIEIVTGKEEFLGMKINARHNRVIYVSTEDDSNAISSLLNHYGLSAEEIENMENLTYIFDADNILEEIEKNIIAKPADLIIVDAFTDLYSGDLNMTTKVRDFLNEFRRITLKHNCLVLFVHHPNKRAELDTPNKNSLLGSQGIEAKARLVLDFRKESANPDYRRLHITKGNYISDERKKFGLRLKMNENMTFEVLDNEISLRSSSPTMLQNVELQNKKIKRVHELVKDGKSTRQIVDTMKDEGYDISLGSVSNYKKMECSTVQLPKDRE